MTGEDFMPTSTPPSLTRRKFLAGSLLSVGLASAVADGETVSAFRDTDSAAGTLRTASLRTAVTDNFTNQNGVDYQLSHEAIMETEFDRVDVTVREDGTVVETFTGLPREDSVSFTNGKKNRTYEFEFALFGTWRPEAVLVETITDQPDGTDPPSDDMGSPDDPSLQQFTVTDQSSPQDGAQAEVSYQVADAGGFAGFVRVKFRNQSNSTKGNRTLTNGTVASGTVSYPGDGSKVNRNQTLEVTVEVVKDSGIVVDSGSVVWEPDSGTDPSWP